MKPGLDADEIIGKTIVATLEGQDGTHWGDEHWTLVFADGSYARIGWRHLYDGDGEIELSDLELTDIFSAKAEDQCVALGIVTAEEIEAERKRMAGDAERRREWEDRRERDRYEELKRKFEGGV